MGDVIVGFCIDQSGSMGSGREVTVKGFNDFIDEQKAQPGRAYLSLVLFDSQPVVRFSAGDMNLVDPLGTPANGYSPCGNTALYDGVAETIGSVERFLLLDPNFKGHKIVVILTDGEENSSRNCSLDALNAKISDKRENEGWEFIFMGSGGAAWTEGRKMQVAPSSTLNYADNYSSQQVYAGLSSSLSTARITGTTVDEQLQT